MNWKKLINDLTNNEKLKNQSIVVPTGNGLALVFSDSQTGNSLAIASRCFFSFGEPESLSRAIPSHNHWNNNDKYYALQCIYFPNDNAASSWSCLGPPNNFADNHSCYTVNHCMNKDHFLNMSILCKRTIIALLSGHTVTTSLKNKKVGEKPIYTLRRPRCR